MKRMLSGVLAFLLVLSLVPAVPLTAQAATSGIYTYTITTSGAMITEVDAETGGRLTVPSTLGGYSVVAIGARAFEYCDFSTIILPDTVRTIGEYAFYYCTALKSVTLPSGLTTLGRYAFAYCSSLTSVTIPEGITRLEYSTFYKCTALKTVTVPDSVTYMSGSVFGGCTALESICLPFVGITAAANGTKESVFGYIFGFAIGEGYIDQVYNDASTDSVYIYGIPASLTTVTITDTTLIPSGAFSGCTNIANINICETVTEVGYNAFHNTAWYNSQPDGVIYVGKVAHDYKGTCPESVEIQDGIVTIGEYAFYKDTTLKSITLPDSVTTIGDRAFKGCTNLSDITLPAQVKTIRDSAFFECESLAELTIPYGVKTIGDHAFYGCTSLKEAVIPNSVNSMGIWAFAESGVEFVSLSSAVNELPMYAFYNCSNLQKVFVPRYVWGYGYYTFGNCLKLAEVYYVGSYTDRLDIMESESGNTDFFNAWWYFETCSGEHTYTADCDALCDKCDWERVTETAHIYSNACDTTCNSCNTVRKTEHVYTNSCDTQCNICYASRVITHTYANACDTACDVCGATRDVPNHVYDNNCDTGCNECGATREVPDHVYDNNCDTDCNECGYIREVPDHVYDNDCDTVCNECGLVRTVSGHAYAWVVDKAETCGEAGIKHEECTICHATQNENTAIEATGLHTYENVRDVICDVCEKERKLTSISITAVPGKTAYLEGKDLLDTQGGELTLTYDDGTYGIIAVETAMVSGFDNTLLGEQTLTVAYGGFTDTYSVEIVAKALTSIAVTTLPAKRSYLEGAEFDPAGMVVTAYYNNDTSEAVTGYTVSGYDSAPGIKTITVAYQGMTASFTVEVMGKSLVSIAVTNLPDRLTYLSGAEFDPTGMVVTACYDNDTSEAVTDYTVSGYDATPGTKTIIVTYGDFTDSFAVTVTHTPGDVDTNGEVSTDDVVALLLHISMPDLFPIAVEADFDGDGNITTEDAIKLLLHISMPDMFPL